MFFRVVLLLCVRDATHQYFLGTCRGSAFGVARASQHMGLERAADVAHKLVATGLMLGAVGGFSFCMMGCYDLVAKA